MELADLERLIKTRRSIRAWQDKEVPEEMLLRAIELATWAPNGGNQQSWRFYVIVNRGTISAIADAVQSRDDLLAEMARGGGFAAALSRQRRADFFKTAPAAIAIAATKYQSTADKVLAVHEKTDSRAREMRQWRNAGNSRIQSVASAIAHMLLALHQMGLGAVWMGGPTQAKGEIERILRMPQELDFVALIPVGYPAENPTPPRRKPVSEVCVVVR